MEQGIDLFDVWEDIPSNVKTILDNNQDNLESGDYYRLNQVLNELGEIGYVFDYYLDGVPYDLRPIGTYGKAELDSIH